MNYSIEKQDDTYFVIKNLRVIASFETEKEAKDFISSLKEKQDQQKWFFESVEKADRIEMQELLQDGWEPYAADNRFHYLKKAAK